MGKTSKEDWRSLRAFKLMQIDKAYDIFEGNVKFQIFSYYTYTLNI